MTKYNARGLVVGMWVLLAGIAGWLWWQKPSPADNSTLTTEPTVVTIPSGDLQGGDSAALQGSSLPNDVQNVVEETTEIQ